MRIFVSNCATLEIVDDKYDFSTYAFKVDWLENTYYLKQLDLSDEFKPVSELLNKIKETPNINNCPRKVLIR